MRALIILAVAGMVVQFGASGEPAPPANSGIEVHVDTKAKPWTSLDLNNSPDTFRFAVIADNTGGPRAGVFSETLNKLNMLQPEFVVGTGDLIEGYEDTREKLEKQWTRFGAEMSKLQVPYFFVPGNHDSGRPLWLELYKEHFGVPYYHFLYKNVLFLCLFTNDGANNETGLGREQVDYAKKTLAEHANVRYTFVFQHKPLWNENNAEWKEIEASLKGRKCTVFAGHTHNYLSQVREGISYVTQATVGAGTQLRGSAYGELDHIVWVTMGKDGVHIANITLDGILDKDFRTPETAKELSLFSMGRAVTAAPIHLEAGQLTTASSHLTITNPSDTPLRIKLFSETPVGVRVEPGSVSTVIAGKAKYEVDLKVTSEQPVPAPKVQPIDLHWTADYDHGNNTAATELKGETRIIIDAPFTIAAAAKAPVIDGKLDDWADLPYVMEQPGSIYNNVSAWKGVQDGSFRFGVSYDSEYLYVAVKALDDQPCFEGWKYWEDFATVYVDARGADSDDPKTSIFSVMAGPGLDADQKKEYEIGAVPDGVKAMAVPVAGGFESEFAIPIAYLNAHQGGDWKKVHLNVAFSDFDTSDARDGVTILHWRPQWTERRLNSDFGIFTKAAK